MSVYTPYPWPIADLSAVCASQSVISSLGGNLLLNGTLTGNSSPNQISFITSNFIRSVSITSTNNISDTSFIIQGFQNGGYVSETITGPDSATVYGTKYYDVITQVTASKSVSQVNIGTGNAGFLPLIVVNSLANDINYTISVILSSGSSFIYTLLQTLESVSFNYITYQDQLTKFFPCDGLTEQTISKLVNYKSMTNYLLFQVNSSITPITDSISFTFLQE